MHLQSHTIQSQVCQYESEFWHFRIENVDHTTKVINTFQWEISLENMNLKDMINLFNKIIKKMDDIILFHIK